MILLTSNGNSGTRAVRVKSSQIISKMLNVESHFFRVVLVFSKKRKTALKKKEEPLVQNCKKHVKNLLV